MPIWSEYLPNNSLAWLLAIISISGLNLSVWASIGLFRYLGEKMFLPKKLAPGKVRVRITTTGGIESRDILVTKSKRHPFSWKWFWSLFLWPITGFHRRPHHEIFLEVPDHGTEIKIEKYELPAPLTAADVAVIIPAHNEELSIGTTLTTLLTMIPGKNIYVGSDNSKDRTAEVVGMYGCNVAEITPNKGKAGVLSHLITHFNLLEKYKIIMIVDADVEIDPQYLTRALPLFENPAIAAVAGHAASRWQPHIIPQASQFFSAYRVRLYRIFQIFMKYGQTSHYANVTTIVPGFASMYRSSALAQINITPPGLIIEDFNMTFEVHHKRLGKIGYDPGAVGVTQDPFTLRDYIRQVKRWNLGFWQTVRYHGVWPSVFWASLGFFMLELFFFSLFLLAMPLLLIYFISHSFDPIMIHLWPGGWAYQLSLLDVFFGVFIIDYAITLIVALIEKKPPLIWYGLGFIFLRYVDAVMLLYTIPLSFSTKSTGSWVSPERR